ALAITNRASEGAAVQAKSATVFVNVLQEIVEASSADSLHAGITGQGFSTLVPIGDSTVMIDEINAIVQTVK
ncbi:MAG: hypothetical protein WA628_04630, partial [Terriglobales bacterium]